MFYLYLNIGFLQRRSDEQLNSLDEESIHVQRPGSVDIAVSMETEDLDIALSLFPKTFQRV